MISLGLKRKELHGNEPCSPCCDDKDWENEIVYPEIHVSGKLAEMMGAEELGAGDAVTVQVLLRVKSHSKNEENGKVSYAMTLCIEEMAEDLEVAEEDADEADYSSGKNLMSVIAD